MNFVIWLSSFCIVLYYELSLTGNIKFNVKKYFLPDFKFSDSNFIACLWIAHFTKLKNYIFLAWILILI